MQNTYYILKTERDLEVEKEYIFDKKIDWLNLNGDKGFVLFKDVESLFVYYSSGYEKHYIVKAIGEVVAGYKCYYANNIKIIKELEYVDNDFYLALYTKDEAKQKAYTTHPNYIIREYLAKNVNISPDILNNILYKDKEWRVRREVAGNRNVNIKTLKRLAKDKNKFVLFAVAQNNTTSIELLMEILKNQEYGESFINALLNSVKTPNHFVPIIEKFRNR